MKAGMMKHATLAALVALLRMRRRSHPTIEAP